MITENAYAKINLSLDVKGTLPNGYHEVRMIMQTVDIRDILTFEKTSGGITIDVGGSPLPEDGDNLIHKAVSSLFEKCGTKGGVKISLEKHIPIAAGMAGGSSDAAAALRGVNRLYDLGLSYDELRETGLKTGADVPYCIEGGTVLAEGIGEKLTLLPSLPPLTLAVAKPKGGVSTGNIYKALDQIFDTVIHPDTDGMLGIIRSQSVTAASLSGYLGNVLEYVTVPLCPDIDRIKEIFKNFGAAGTLMTGSGPTVFAFFDDEKTAGEAVSEVLARDICGKDETFVTKLTDPEY